MSENTDTAIPPKLFELNEQGLLKEGINYIYDESGSVDWRKIIPTKFLYLKPDPKSRQQLEKKYNKSYNEINIVEDKVEDKDLVINLAGIRWLANVRGVESIKCIPIESNIEYASVNCSIIFTPNYETRMQKKEWSDNACATPNNTNGFYKHYLVEAATNRAFCRTVRSFLNIAIVSSEEISNNQDNEDQPQETSVQDPKKILQERLKAKNRTFDELRAKLIKEGMKEAEGWTDLDSIPKFKIFEIIGILDKGNKK